MNDPQDFAAALAREFEAAASTGISVNREIIDFRFSSSTAFRVQVDIQANQVDYRLQSAAWALRGDLHGTTTSTSPATGLETVSIYFLTLKVGEFHVTFTTDFDQQTASADIRGAINGQPLCYSGTIGAWANNSPCDLLPEEASSAAASAAS